MCSRTVNVCCFWCRRYMLLWAFEPLGPITFAQMPQNIAFSKHKQTFSPRYIYICRWLESVQYVLLPYTHIKSDTPSNCAFALFECVCDGHQEYAAAGGALALSLSVFGLTAAAESNKKQPTNVKCLYTFINCCGFNEHTYNIYIRTRRSSLFGMSFVNWSYIHMDLHIRHHRTGPAFDCKLIWCELRIARAWITVDRWWWWCMIWLMLFAHTSEWV